MRILLRPRFGRDQTHRAPLEALFAVTVLPTEALKGHRTLRGTQPSHRAHYVAGWRLAVLSLDKFGFIGALKLAVASVEAIVPPD